MKIVHKYAGEVGKNVLVFVVIFFSLSIFYFSIILTSARLGEIW